MKKIIILFFVFNSLISCTQISTKKKYIEINENEIEFATIIYNKTIPNKYNKIDIRKLTNSQINKLVKTLENLEPRGFCKIGATYVIKTYLKNDSIRIFRGNNKTIKEKTDFCFTLKNKNFYNNLWNNSDNIKIDSTRITVLPFNDFNTEMFEFKSKATLSSKELKEIETILQNRLNSEKLKELSNYFRQYIPIYNLNNEKEVWINFLCKTNNLNWKNERIIVKDGGNCYFNLKINLKYGIIDELHINGNG